jgi:uncharacterized protein YuzE
MVISLDKLVEHLQGFSKPDDASPSDALWIQFGQGKTLKTVEYRTSTANEILHVYVDENDALVGIEIFP